MNIRALTRILGILVLVLLTFGGLQAQPLCGGIPSVKLSVRDLNDKPIENASVQLIPLGIDDTAGQTFVRQAGNTSIFKIRFNRFVEGEYQLVVSAEGYKTAEERIKFFDCVSRKVYLISRTHKTGVIRGTVFDKHKIAILRSPILILFTNEKRIRFESRPDDFGDYELRLPFGKYFVGAYHYKLNQFFECRSFVIDKKEIEFDIYLREQLSSQAEKNECSAMAPGTKGRN